MDLLLWLSLTLIGLFIYFIPTILAYDHNHSKHKAILVMNILLGWTVIGWALAIIWACTEKNKSAVEKENKSNRKDR